MKEVLTFLLSCLCIYSVQGQSNSNETCLNFGELPRVTSRAEPAPTLIENGLRAWARLPQAFVDATGRRGLPIDALRRQLPGIVTNCRDSPSQCPPRQNPTGFISGLLQADGLWWGPLLAVTIIGVLFAIVFIIVGIIFCCCRLCGHCGGGNKQNKRKHEGCIKLILGIILTILTLLLVIGAIIALVGNEQVFDNVGTFGSDINSELQFLTDFLEETKTEFDTVIDQSDVFLGCAEMEIQDSANSLVEKVVSNISTTQLKNDANSTRQSLSQVNESVANISVAVSVLGGSLATLNVSLVDLRSDLQSVYNACSTISNISSCEDIQMTIMQLQLNTPDLNQINSVLSTTSRRLDDAALQIDNFLNGSTLFSMNNSVLQPVINKIRSQSKELQSDARTLIDQEIIAFIDEIVNTSGIAEARRDIESATGYIVQTQTIIYGFVILFCCFVLIVVVILVIALIFGICGHRSKRAPWERSKLSHCASILLMVAAGLMFFFAFLLLILCATVFFIGAFGQKTCYSIGEESNYELFSEVFDAKIWNQNETENLYAYLSVSPFLKNISASNILRSCKENSGLYEAFNLEYNLPSSLSPTIDSIFEEQLAIPSVSDLLGLVPSNTIDLPSDQLDNLMNITSGDQFSFTDEIRQLNQSSINVTVDDLLNSLTIWSPLLPASASEIANISAFVNQTVRAQVNSVDGERADLVSQLEQLELRGTELQILAEQTLLELKNVVNRTNMFDIAVQLNETISNLRGRLFSLAKTYQDYGLQAFKEDIGSCSSIYSRYIALYNDICESTLVGVNAFWWSLGWCVLFFIPTIIVSVILASFFKKMSGADDGSSNGGYEMSGFKW